MALYGILGEIHGNLEALRAVLTAFDARGVKKILCVGDVVGYNADPDECAALLRARNAVAIAGKCDLIGARLRGFEPCSNDARHALSRTRKELKADTVAWLRALPANRRVDDAIALVGGGEPLRLAFPTACVFFGHDQEQKLYDFSGEMRDLPLRTPLEKDRVYFISAGSVDAQHKRSARLAECAVFDTDSWSVEFLKLRYDAASTEAKAAVGGYRMVPAIDALYTMHKRAAQLPKIAEELTRAVQAFSADLLRRKQGLEPR
jgi:hypothetical protein